VRNADALVTQLFRQILQRDARADAHLARIVARRKIDAVEIAHIDQQRVPAAGRHAAILVPTTGMLHQVNLEFLARTKEVTSTNDATMRFQAAGTPLVVLAGREYGTGSSRDWAAKGTMLLGLKIVIAESFERIHRSNMVGMGVLPCKYLEGQTAASLGSTGKETFDFTGIGDGTGKRLNVVAMSEDGSKKEFEARVLLETPKE
jgi:aconitase A